MEAELPATLDLEEIAQRFRIVGRRTELRAILACLRARRNVLLEGPVGADEPQGAQTCERMAIAGRGRRYRAATYPELPAIVRRLVRECFEA